MTQQDFDGFTVNVFLDDDDEWVAHFVEMPNISAFADTPDEAVKELRTAWEGAKESYRKHGEKIPVAPANRNYSGQFNVRLDKRIHKALVMEATQAGISLNALVAQKLTKGIHIDN